MILLITAMILVGINIIIMYLELKPFLDAVAFERDRSTALVDRMSLPFRVVAHTPKLLPFSVDVVAVIVLSTLFSMGSGLSGGVTSLFSSCLVSAILYSRRFRKKYTIGFKSL